VHKLGWDKLIVALDLEDKRKIKSIIRALSPKVRKFKAGLVTYVNFGPEIVNIVKNYRAEVFLDLKFFDIPNTMIKAAESAASLGVWAFTVHIKAGREALSQLKKNLTKFCKAWKIRRPLIFGVSELTSKQTSQSKVLGLVGIAASVGLDGVVCSAWEASSVRGKYKNLKIVTPGIRRKQDATADQKRIATARGAFTAGADYIVVGRPIIQAKEYLQAAEDILRH